MNALAKRLRWVIGHMGITANAWAEKTPGLARDSISKFLKRTESDSSHDMKLATVVALAQTANVRVEWLTCGSGNPTTEGEILEREVVPADNIRSIVRQELETQRVELIAAFTGKTSAFPKAIQDETKKKLARPGSVVAAHALDRAAIDPDARKPKKRR